MTENVQVDIIVWEEFFLNN